VLDKTLTEVHVAAIMPREAAQREPAEREAAERQFREWEREAAEWRARELAEREAAEREAAERRAAEREREAPERRDPARPRRRWRSWVRRWSEARRSPVGRSTPPERPGPDDDVSFTAGYPGVVTPHSWYSLLVYVHLSRLQAEADRRIADESQWFGLHPASSKAAAHVPLPKGTQLRISPDVPGVVFNPTALEVRWLEDLQQVAFRLQATPEAAGHTVLGAVEVYAGPLLVAQVPLSIHVRGADEPHERPDAAATSTAQLFSSVFASYAHEDNHVVQAFAEAYRALGIDVLVDKASLRAGQDWQQMLLRLIEEADLFQLFWSEAASQSRYVAEEWQHALLLQNRKGERFIRPLYWTSPWPPPPAQLAHLHFAALDLAALSASRADRDSR
jgi:TIR domain